MFLEKKEYIKPTTYWLFSLLFILFIIILVGGLTRLTDSGLSITRWEVITGILPPFTLDGWNKAFDLTQRNTPIQLDQPRYYTQRIQDNLLLGVCS